MILLIPDIHEQLDRLVAIETIFPEFSRRIFLGDWFDSFDLNTDTRGVTKFLKRMMEDEKNDFCWGNHDCHYAFENQGFMCSGFRPATKFILEEEMKQNDWRRFKLFHRVGDTVVSHAGFHPKYCHGVPIDPSEDEAESAIQSAFDGGFHRLWNPGAAVGGRGIGGPTWLRPIEFDPTPFPQVFGHTPGNAIREFESHEGVKSYCIDTHLKHLLVLDDDGRPAEIIEIQATV